MIKRILLTFGFFFLFGVFFNTSFAALDTSKQFTVNWSDVCAGNYLPKSETAITAFFKSKSDSFYYNPNIGDFGQVALNLGASLPNPKFWLLLNGSWVVQYNFSPGCTYYYGAPSWSTKQIAQDTAYLWALPAGQSLPTAPQIPPNPQPVTYDAGITYDVKCISAGTLYEKVNIGVFQPLGTCTENQVFNRTMSLSVGTSTFAYYVNNSNGDSPTVSFNVTRLERPLPSAPTFSISSPVTTYHSSLDFQVTCVSAGTLLVKAGTSPAQNIATCTDGQVFNIHQTLSLGTASWEYSVYDGYNTSNVRTLSITRVAPASPQVPSALPALTSQTVTFYVTCINGGAFYEKVGTSPDQYIKDCVDDEQVQRTRGLNVGENTFKYFVQTSDGVRSEYSSFIVTRDLPLAPQVPASPQEPTSMETFTFNVQCLSAGTLYEKVGTSPPQNISTCTENQTISRTRGLNMGDNTFSYYVVTSDGAQSSTASFIKTRVTAYTPPPPAPIILNTTTSQTTRAFTLQVKSNSDNTQIECDWNGLGAVSIGGVVNSGVTVTKDFTLVYGDNSFDCTSNDGKLSQAASFSVNVSDAVIAYKAPKLIAPTPPFSTYDNSFSVIVESQEKGYLYCNNGILTKKIALLNKGDRATYIGDLSLGSNTFTCFTRIQDTPVINSPFLTMTVTRLVSATETKAPQFIISDDQYRTSQNPYSYKIKNMDSGDLYCKYNSGSYSQIASLTQNQEQSLTIDFSQYGDTSKAVIVVVTCYTLKSGVASQEVQNVLTYNPNLITSCIQNKNALSSSETDKGLFIGLFNDLWNSLMKVAVIGDYAWLNCVMKNDFIDHLQYEPVGTSTVLSVNTTYLGAPIAVSLDINKPIQNLQDAIIQKVGRTQYDSFRWITTSMFVFMALWGMWSSMAFGFTQVKNEGLAYSNTNFKQRSI